MVFPMHQDGTSTFSGVSGRVLREAFSAGTLLSGVCLGLFIALGGWLLARLGAIDMVPPFAQIVVALALARVAVNGMSGEWGGTIFSSAGGSWTRAAVVAAYYLLLSATWLLPVFLLAPATDELGTELASLAQGTGGGRLPALLLAWLLGIGVTPPVFLIVAVSAAGFGDLVSPAHWKRLFQGRLGDLWVICVLYLGSMVAAFVLTLPLAAAAFGQGIQPGLFVSGLALLFACGLAVVLLGRLCGFYAFDEPQSIERQAAVQPLASAARPIVPSRPSPGGSDAIAPAAGPSRASTAGQQPRLAGAAVAPAKPAARPAGAAGAAPTAADSLRPSGKPPLMDAQRRVDEARGRMEQDPSGAISALEELRASYAPNPLVLHALCLMLHGAGQLVEALEVAREVLPLCFERGNLAPAAEIFRALSASVKELGLNRDQILSIAAALVKMGDLGTAVQTYAAVVRRDASERRAIKGLLQIADLKLQDPARTAEAEKIFRFLLQNCASSPLADDMRRGLEEAQRRLAHVR